MKTEGMQRMMAVLVLWMVTAFSLPTQAKSSRHSTTKSANGPRTRTVQLDLYVMSRCPFAARMMGPLLDVVQALGRRVHLRVDYIVQATPDGGLSSLHGPAEVLRDKAQVCAKKLTSSARYLQFLRCQYEDVRSPSHEWKACAAKVGISARRLRRCVQGPEAARLLLASARRASTNGVRGSPTLMINGRKYHGGRTKRDLLRAVCDSLSGRKPKACRNLPKPVAFDLLVLSDKRCKSRNCTRAEGIVRSLIRAFPGATVRRLDYSTRRGKRLYRRAHLRYLPAILLSKAVRKAASYSRFSRWLTPAGPYLSLRLGATFDPTKEICDNGIDDDHNGKTDCADPSCTARLVCRPLQPLRLDLFSMSHCPFCRKAIRDLPKVLSAFGGRIRFHLHLIGRVDATGRLHSMHGPAEIEEDLREVCVAHFYPHSLVSYLACRAKNPISSPWQSCALALDTNRIKSCARGKLGQALLKKSFAFSKRLGIGASPTWIANNRFKFSGLSAQTICENIKKHNPAETVDCLQFSSPPSKTGMP